MLLFLYIHRFARDHHKMQFRHKEIYMKIKNSLLAIGIGLLLAAPCVHAQATKISTNTQPTVSDVEVDLMRKDLRDQKKQIVSGEHAPNWR